MAVKLNESVVELVKASIPSSVSLDANLWMYLRMVGYWCYVRRSKRLCRNEQSFFHSGECLDEAGVIDRGSASQLWP